jgi:hypothetical protein
MGKRLAHYWGYIALALVILGWVTHVFGYVAILIVSFMTLIYFLVQAPLTCVPRPGAKVPAGTTLTVH